MTTTTTFPRRPAAETASGLDLLLGVWIVISTWILAYPAINGAQVNQIVCGAVILCLAALRLFARNAGWLSFLIALLGIWVLISPWVFGFAWLPANLWNNIGCGAAAILLGSFTGFVVSHDEQVTA